MTTEKKSADPSMEEILSSIRQLIATESGRPPSGSQKSEEILDLTNLLPNETSHVAKTKPKKDSPEKKSMSLPAWAEKIKTPFPDPHKDHPSSRKDDLFIARVAAAETAQALQELTDFSEKKQHLSRKSLASGTDAQTLEHQLREILKPLLKEWLDANLPILVRWIVNEQIEGIIRQYGLTPSDLKK